MKGNDNKSSENLSICNSNYIVSISPDGQIAAIFNSESFTIKLYEIENLATPTVISCNEIRKFDLPSQPVKISYSLAVSNLIRIRGKNDDVLIAVSCFCDKVMMSIDDHHSMTSQDRKDIEKGDDFKKSATFVISKNLKIRIETTVDTHGGVVKFLDSHFKKEIHSEGLKKGDQSNEFTNLIVMNASGITKTFINHDDPYTINITKEYEFPTIIQDKIDNQDIPCTKFLQNSIVSNYLFVEGYRNKKVEMYNLKSLDLEVIFQKHDKTPYSTSLLEDPIFSISNYGHLLAHCSSAKNITIYLMENGLEIVTKEFSNANRILLASFIDDDEKLFIVTEEENDLMINIWDIFTYKSVIRTRKVTDINILNSLQEDNCHLLAISNGTILASLQDGNIFPVLESSDIKSISKSSNESMNLFSVDIEQQRQQSNLLENHSEPWVNHKQYNYIFSYLDESKTIQLIIGKTMVQVWRKRNHGSKTKQVLEYIWGNLNNERIEVTSLKVGNQEFSLDLSTISADKSQNEIKIHWPHETHILKDACDAIKYLYERRYEVRQKNQNKYEKLVTSTEKIIKKCIKKNPDLWKLSEIRYEILANLIQAKRILLLHQILFNFKEANKIDTNGETNIIKVNCYLHNPRQYSWPVKGKKSDLEIAIEESSDEEKAIVAMLLEYYSNNAGKNIGWMFTVTKAIPSLNRRHLENCLKELFYKPCFGAKEEYLNSKFVSKFISQNELKKGYNKKVYPLNIKPQLLEKQNISWWNVKNTMKNIKYKLSKIDNDENTHHATIALRIIPLPDFTVYTTNEIKPQNSSILLKLFKFIVWPKNYFDLSDDQRSPFLKFLDNEKTILYDNPAIEACIEFKWNASRNHFLRRLLVFIVFSTLFLRTGSFDSLSSHLLLVAFIYLGYRLLITKIAQLISEGKKYWNVYNIFDFASIIVSMIAVLVQYIIIHKWSSILRDNSDLDTNNPETVEKYFKDNGVNMLQDVRIVIIPLVSAILIICFEILSLLRMFSSVANYINIIINMILKAVLPLIYFMAFLSIALGTALYNVLESPYIKKSGLTGVAENATNLQDFDFSNPITDIIYLNLGKWNQLDPLNFWPLFLLSIFVSTMFVIVMQNLLIAVMTNIYENAKSNARLVALKCRGELMADDEKTDINCLRRNQRYIYYIGSSDYQEEWLKKAKEFRESHKSLSLVEDISSQLLLTENNSSSDDDSDGDDSCNITKNVTSDNVKEHNDGNIDEKILKLQEEVKKIQNDIKEILSFVKKNT